MATKKQIEVGTRNLKNYRRTHPDHRPNLRHGVYSYLSSGKIPAHIQLQLDEFEAGITHDLRDDLTMAQRVLIVNAKSALAASLLADDWIQRHGVVNEDGEPSPVLGTAVSFMNCLRLSVCALGLKRKPKSANTLEQILEEHSR